MKKKDTLYLKITDEWGAKVYYGKAELTNERALINILNIFSKFNIDLEKIGRVINENMAKR